MIPENMIDIAESDGNQVIDYDFGYTISFDTLAKAIQADKKYNKR